MSTEVPALQSPLPPLLDEPEPASVLRSRARASAEEFQKITVAVSTGSLAVVFLALTQKIEPPLSTPEKSLLLVMLVCMSLAALAAIAAWFADARDHAARATAVEATDIAVRTSALAKRTIWQFLGYLTGIIYLACFAPGIVCAAVYMWMRIG